MSKSMVVGAALGIAVATAGGAIASFSMKKDDGSSGFSFFKKEPQFASVLSTQPITETIKTPRQECRDHTVKVPRQECHNVTVRHQRPVQDQNRVAGSVLGAVVGAALGNQIGDGNGKKAATVLGAAAGGYAGNQVQHNMQRGNTYTTTEQQCSTVHDSRVEQKCNTVYDLSEKIVGYDVTYKLGETQGKVQMSYNPGDKIPVKDGLLVLEQPQTASLQEVELNASQQRPVQSSLPTISGQPQVR
jgi:uncharacterized protein YcfJ